MVFFTSFHEFVREMKIKRRAKHRRQAEGEVSLTELHDDEGIVFQGYTSLVSKSFIVLTAFDIVKAIKGTGMLTRLVGLIYIHVYTWSVMR